MTTPFEDKVLAHPKKYGCIFAVIVAVFIVIIGVLSIAKPWADEAKRVTGPTNVRNQYAKVIGDWQEMITTANNACGAQNSSSENGPTMVEDPAFAFKATYRNIKADYNSRQQDIFKAKAVGPKGYPKVAPNFPEENQKDGDWCAVAEGLIEIHS